MRRTMGPVIVAENIAQPEPSQEYCAARESSSPPTIITIETPIAPMEEYKSAGKGSFNLVLRTGMKRIIPAGWVSAR